MKLVIQQKKVVEIQRELIGLFFEDINYGADGGLYAEYIENRSFEFLDARGDKCAYYTQPAYGYGWSAYPSTGTGANMTYLTEAPLNDVNPHYLRFSAVETQRAFMNKAYDGILIKKGETYHISFYARAIAFNGTVTVQIEKEGQTKATEPVTLTKEWKKYERTLTAQQTMRNGQFIVELSEAGIVDFDCISMMPKSATLGIFRSDLLQLLKELKPGFVRFPGGCIIEGNTLDNRYQWKQSIGDITTRKANWNRWAVHGNNEENEFTSTYRHYNQTLGIGYYEYFLLCEFIGAKAIPVVNVGLACQYQSDELVAIDDPDFQTYVQDAIDLIEFANGDVHTTWGAKRAEMGHPEPFHLEMIGIGNEQWQTEKIDFFERYVIFEKAIHDHYPEMKLIGSAGPDITTERHTAAWAFHNEQAKKKENFAYAVDEHYYVRPDWFLEHDDFYDAYPRDVKVFSGEYAAHPANIQAPECANNLGGALAEAAFLTGIERNADVVILASYAPLFARIGYTQWSPDLIWFDDQQAYGTPSYYVQKMYANYTGQYTLFSSLENEGHPVISKETKLYQTVSYDTDLEEVLIKIVNANEQDFVVNVELEPHMQPAPQMTVMTLHGEAATDCNSIKQPDKIRIVEAVQDSENLKGLLVNGLSFVVLKVKIKM